MATLDASSDELNIRVVYDGPPRVGKSTSLEALTRILSERRTTPVFSPEVANGRTLYFDWMEYLGGWVDGYQVRCQIVSVPGQRALVRRRRLLLEDADVVVFVFESTPDGIESARRPFEELRAWLQRDDAPRRVPIVLQANKQDLPGAIPPERVRDHFPADDHVAFLGATASDGSGIREVFTFAVRLALDSVRPLLTDGELTVGGPTVANGEALLARMKECERPSPSAPPMGGARHATGATGPGHPDDALAVPDDLARPPTGRAAEDATSPRLPTVAVPSGLVWPPVAGRIVLNDIAAPRLGVRLCPDLGWVAEGPARWRVLSLLDENYSDIEEGRWHLLSAARAHAALGTFLSSRRALALAETGEGDWRLWRIAAAEPSLIDSLRSALTDAGPHEMAEHLLTATRELIRAARLVQDLGAAKPLDPLSLGAPPESRFIGLTPDLPSTSGAPDDSLQSLLRVSIRPLVEAALIENRIDVPDVVELLRSAGRHSAMPEPVIDALTTMLIDL